jgi:hypothetical protein
MNRRADHRLPRPVFTQHLPRLAVPGAAVKGQFRTPWVLLVSEMERIYNDTDFQQLDWAYVSWLDFTPEG